MASSRATTLILLITLLWACEPKKLPTPPKADIIAADTGRDVAVAEAPKGPKIVHDEGPMPSDDAPIATAGDIKVTVADFEEASKISLLFAPGDQTTLSPEQLAAPHVHVTMARSLLSQKIISRELERRDLHPTTEELHAYLRDHGRLGKFGAHINDPEALKAELEPLGLTTAQLLKVAWAELGNRMLARAMVAEITDEDIWKTYLYQQTTRTTAIVGAPNVPTPDELDAWVGDHADEIDKHFQENQGKYRTPRRVKLNVVKPAAGTKTTNDVLEKAADMLGRGIQPQTVAKDLGLVDEKNAQLVRGENPKAFGMAAGTVGWTADGPRGAYAWKVIGFEESRLPEMTRPLRREIAAELMRSTFVVDSVKDKLAHAAKLIGKHKFKAKPAELAAEPKLTDKLRASIEKTEPLKFEIASFPNNPSTPLKKHGLAEEVIQASFATEVGKTSDPILSRERGFITHVINASEPVRAEFDANLDEHRKAFITAVQPTLVPQWVERKMNELNATLDVKPLRIKYGALQKE